MNRDRKWGGDCKEGEGEIRWRNRAVKEQLRGEREKTNERVDHLLRRENRLLLEFGSQYRYYSVARILGYSII